MVLHCVEQGPHDLDRATEVIGAFLAGGFAGVDAIGFHLRPTWPIPAEPDGSDPPHEVHPG